MNISPVPSKERHFQLVDMEENEKNSKSKYPTNAVSIQMNKINWKGHHILKAWLIHTHTQIYKLSFLIKINITKQQQIKTRINKILTESF